jgi:hypothetical protein
MLFKGNRMTQPFFYAPGLLMAANSRYKYSHPAILKPSCSRYRRTRPLSVKDQIGWFEHFALKPIELASTLTRPLFISDAYLSNYG